jgi:signal peptidase I
MDYTTIIMQLTAVVAVVWLSDRLFLRHRRRRRAAAAGVESHTPWPVEWASSLLPILLLVLVVRSAVAEPYHIPSGSMMPTLEVGDFIVVSKFSYGLRLPGTDIRIVDLGEPERGDVVVFRPPWAPGESWIKRIVGLPGDEVVVRRDSVWINGEPVSTELIGPYRGDPNDDDDADLMRYGASLLTERLGDVGHPIIQIPRAESSRGGAPDVPNAWNPDTVPAGCYFVMGDNRNNSEDSRYHGCVPEANLVGKAAFVWLSFDSLGRVGTPIR